MTRFKKTPIPQDLREKVFKRDNHTCRYCGNKTGPFHADHVYPESKGGQTSLDNLVTACEKCNMRKRAKVGVRPKPLGYFEVMNERDQMNKRLTRGFPGWWIFWECFGLFLAGLHTWLKDAPFATSWPGWIWYITLFSGLVMFLFFFSLQIGWTKK